MMSVSVSSCLFDLRGIATICQVCNIKIAQTGKSCEILAKMWMAVSVFHTGEMFKFSELDWRFFETPEVGIIGIFILLKYEKEIELVTSDISFNSISH